MFDPYFDLYSRPYSDLCSDLDSDLDLLIFILILLILILVLIFDLDFVDPVSACGQIQVILCLLRMDGFSTTVCKPLYSHPTYS